MPDALSPLASFDPSISRGGISWPPFSRTVIAAPVIIDDELDWEPLFGVNNDLTAILELPSCFTLDEEAKDVLSAAFEEAMGS